jgi:hypothetical protein
MNRPPAFQFYPRDWRDFRVQRMSYHARGIYIELLGFMWADSRDCCSLIDDDALIARALGVAVEEWLTARKEIQWESDPIFLTKKGNLISARLRKEFTKLKQFRKQCSAAGRKGMESRWKSASPENNVAITPVIPKHNSSSSIPISSSSSKEKENTHTLLKKESGCVSSFMSQEPEAEHTQAQKKYTVFRADAAQAAFELFWKVYPNKTSTGDVEEWFRTHPVTPNLICDMELAITQ